MLSFNTEPFEMLKVGITKKNASLYSFVRHFYSKKIEDQKLWLAAPKNDMSNMLHHFEYKRLETAIQKKVLFVKCIEESEVIYPIFYNEAALTEIYRQKYGVSLDGIHDSCEKHRAHRSVMSGIPDFIIESGLINQYDIIADISVGLKDI